MNSTEAYSGLDRFIHRVAFGNIGVQTALADLEDILFASRLASVSVQAPVFVTALPRAGTTLLLEVLSAFPGFASHTYRQMPFVLCPLLWDWLSRHFRKRAELRERSHGDSVLIGYDSPEAFEEIVWKAFWQENYTESYIQPWSSAARDEDFETFLRSHICKVVALSSAKNGSGEALRYLSKNNANIARLDLLQAIFPDCQIIVPVRNPQDHVASLRQQHARFTRIHAEDAFSRRYMEWLGHFEFGAALKPINFAEWLDGGPEPNPRDDTFWFLYWAVSYEAILASAGPRVHFIDYDRACREPIPVLEAIAAVLGLDSASSLVAQAGRFRPATRHRHDAQGCDAAMLKRVSEIHEAVCARAL